MYQKKYMDEAVSLSRQCLATGKGGPFGAVVVKDGQIVGRGSNHVTLINDPTAHAEVMAIRDACQRLNTFQLTGCEIYTSCEPCPMCYGAIYWARPDKVYYAATRVDAMQAGFDDSYIYEELNLPLNERGISAEQHDAGEAAEVLKTWFKLDQKIDY